MESDENMRRVPLPVRVVGLTMRRKPLPVDDFATPANPRVTCHDMTLSMVIAHACSACLPSAITASVWRAVSCSLPGTGA